VNENPTTSEAEAIGQTTDYRTDQSPNSGGMQERSQEKAQEMAGKAREAAGEYGHKAQDQLDKGTDQAAGGLEQAADKLRSQTGNSEGMPAQAGAKVADSMETTASYLREHNTEEILNDVEHYVKEHPTQALVGAVVAGFMIGRVLR
jgi:ElaB/YqjD/DUF883 family membrane-anchored ribosome-binding protein